MPSTGVSRLKLPSISVMTPILVPFIITFAPTMGSPKASFIVPVIGAFLGLRCSFLSKITMDLVETIL